MAGTGKMKLNVEPRRRPPWKPLTGHL